ncbi:GAP family protein [Actinospica sp. MGRD01-02]|uniref:GAP family protein n=1 Tax=Actinospica acidithermotolerans TaxID=2828514 RepID=A0A941E7L9_9ACTN|nr:GAP family protein [Actinospica acidithermotolerans]MBR7826566.1 GAP family protein [Actinospica acidithermotolerans]
MLEAVPTALVAAFSPWTLLIVAGLLNKERPLRRALVFLAAAAVVTLLVGFLVVEALGGSGLEDHQRHPTFSPAVDLGLGLAILLSVPFLARRASRPPKDKSAKPPRTSRSARKRRRRRREEAGVLAVIALGLFAGSPSPMYLASLHSVSKGQPDAVASTFEVLLIAFLVLLMAEIPILLYAASPERTTAFLTSANAWLALHGRMLVVFGAAAVGSYFTIEGLAHLL